MIEALKTTLEETRRVLGEFKNFRLEFIHEKDLIDLVNYVRNPREDTWRGWFYRLGGKKNYWVNTLLFSGFPDGISDILCKASAGKCNIKVLVNTIDQNIID